jgi:UDP-glucuronate decarboxylase
MEDVVEHHVAGPRPWAPNISFEGMATLSRLTGHRVLIVGASGWIGRAVRYLLEAQGCPTLLTASQASPGVSAWNFEIANNFAPTRAFFLAGVAPITAQAISLREYTDRLARITKVLEEVTSVKTIDWMAYASSGATIAPMVNENSPRRNLYRDAKLHEEQLVREWGSTERQAFIVRIYSLSGPFAAKDSPYALFDLIRQANSGKIRLTSGSRIVRSYVSVTDLAYNLLSSMASGDSGDVSTGGEAVELQQLARIVAEIVNPKARIDQVQQTSHDYYVGEDERWQSWCQSRGLTPQSLHEQVAISADWVRQAL